DGVLFQIARCRKSPRAADQRADADTVSFAFTDSGDLPFACADEFRLPASDANICVIRACRFYGIERQQHEIFFRRVRTRRIAHLPCERLLVATKDQSRAGAAREFDKLPPSD